MRILDVLARIQTGETFPLVELVREQGAHLPWGTTLIIISPDLGEPMFEALFQARGNGLNAMLVACGPVKEVADVRKRAAYFGFPLYQLLSESDMDIWRQ